MFDTLLRLLIVCLLLWTCVHGQFAEPLLVPDQGGGQVLVYYPLALAERARLLARVRSCQLPAGQLLSRLLGGAAIAELRFRNLSLQV